MDGIRASSQVGERSGDWLRSSDSIQVGIHADRFAKTVFNRLSDRRKDADQFTIDPWAGQAEGSLIHPKPNRDAQRIAFLLKVRVKRIDAAMLVAKAAFLRSF